MMNEPYAVNQIRDAQWLVSMLELFCLEQGFTQAQVNAWIIQQLIDNNNDTDTQDTKDHE